MRGAAGCSIGALLALCLVAGVPPIEAACTFYPLASGLKGKRPSLKQAWLMSGVCDLDDVRTGLVDILRARSFDADITLGELHARTGRELVIVVNEVRNSTVTLLRSTQHPQVHAVDAVIASMSIPLIFRPVQIRGIHPSLYFADGGVQLNFPWSAFVPGLSLGIWIVESPKKVDPLEEIEHKCRTQGPGAPSGVPGLRVVFRNLQRSLLRRLTVAEQHQFLLGPRHPRHHVIALFTDAGAMDFGRLDVPFASEMLRRGIFLAALHYLAIPVIHEAPGTSWGNVMTAVASLYENVPAEVLRRLVAQQTAG
jgi:predicted acylesterase/phospholipase RssA